MRWRRRHDWPDRPARPKVRRLSADERDKYLSGMIRAIERSPVLSALSFEVCALRGRFYFERCYWYYRKPHILEVSRDRRRVLVRFSTSSLSGEFGGTCLYICREGRWDAFTIRPSESDDIASAERWLEKRKWRAWT